MQRLAAPRPDWQASVVDVEPADTTAAVLELLEGGARLVVGVGVRVGVPDLEINTAAINWLAMRSEADALHFGPIDAGLPVELTLDAAWQRTVMGCLDRAGAAFALSTDAGMHACNLALFQAIAHAPPDTRVLFVHVGPNVLERPRLIHALGRAIEALVRELPRMPPSPADAASPR